MDQAQLQRAILMFVAFLFSICFHEFAHAWMAYKKGDNTAKLMGRMSMNPAVHADLLGTIILPIMGLLGAMVFGWAKPVPVNSSNLKNVKSDMFWIAAAGPGSNLILAFIGVLGMVIAARMGELHSNQLLSTFLSSFITINLILCFFNLIPIHPLDGGKILARFLPDTINQKLEEMQAYGMLIIFALLLTGALGVIVGTPVRWTLEVMQSLALVLIP